ncbi:MAG: ABC transporter permease [Ignavibacteriales bacterium]|nr:ABC transporter permease [Ignavibacteriales bacterium]
MNQTIAPDAPHRRSPFHFLSRFLERAGSLTVFSARFFPAVVLPPYELGEVGRHLDELGSRSLPLAGITGFIVGLIIAMQTRPTLFRFGADSFLPAMVAISFVRELGPVITALIVAGRVSSGIGAELGSMRVTEQIDAMEVSGIDPYKYLVVTRVLACIILQPLLTAIVNSVGLFGAYVAVAIESSMSWRLYWDSVIQSLSFADVIPGLAKTAIFGFIIGIVGCHQGYHAEGGTVGVGKAATTAVVLSSMLIIFVDMILVKLTVMLWP